MNKDFISDTPLTVGQLRTLNNQPIWIKDLEEPQRSGWYIIYWDIGKYLTLSGNSCKGYILEQYLKSWVAYVYSPKTPTVEDFVEYWHTHETNSTLQEFLGMSSQEYETWLKEKHITINREAWEPCAVCNVFPKDWREYQYEFCPYCGRPLTEEAWAELEKRVEDCLNLD